MEPETEQDLLDTQDYPSLDGPDPGPAALLPEPTDHPTTGGWLEPALLMLASAALCGGVLAVSYLVATGAV